MARVYGHEIGKAVCLALGVDPDTCVEIDLRARVGELATVTVETYAEPKDMEPLATELRKYHLVPIESIFDLSFSHARERGPEEMKAIQEKIVAELARMK